MLHPARYTTRFLPLNLLGLQYLHFPDFALKTSYQTLSTQLVSTRANLRASPQNKTAGAQPHAAGSQDHWYNPSCGWKHKVLTFLLELVSELKKNLLSELLLYCFTTPFRLQKKKDKFWSEKVNETHYFYLANSTKYQSSTIVGVTGKQYLSAVRKESKHFHFLYCFHQTCSLLWFGAAARHIIKQTN